MQGSFRDRVKALAKAAGSQRALARWMGVSGPAVIAWLAGSKPFESTLIGISKKTGLDLDWLQSGHGDEDDAINLARRSVNIGWPRMALYEARKKSGMNLKDLSEKTGYKVDVLRAVEEGRGSASERMIEALCRALPLEKDVLMGGSDYPMTIQESGGHGSFGAKPAIQLPKGKRARYVPLLSWAQAGALDAGHVDEGYDYQGALSIDISDPKAFAVSVRGNSMEPKISEGSDAIVCPSWELVPGDTVITLTKKGDVYCKVYQPQKDGDLVILTSYNPDHEPIILQRREIKWIYPVGQVVQNLRKQ